MIVLNPSVKTFERRPSSVEVATGSIVQVRAKGLVKTTFRVLARARGEGIYSN